MKLPAAMLALGVALAACVEKSPPPTVEPAGPRLVKATEAAAADMAGEQRYSGEVRARHETTLGFRVGGKIVERLVDAGARVKAGQPLARLDPADARLAASQADANLALAQAELRRGQELKAKSFISQAALDARETAAKATEVQAKLAHNQAAYTALAADANGIVEAVLAEPGQVVAAGQGVFRLAHDGEREVAIALPEAALAGSRAGSPAEITLWAGGKTFAGRIREIAPAADPATRTFATRVTIVGAPADLPLGLTAIVNLAGEGTRRIVVPPAALFQDGNRAAVWVIGKENAVELRPVAVDHYADAGVVLKGGLAVGERIVAAGAFKLTAGEKVRIAQ